MSGHDGQAGDPGHKDPNQAGPNQAGPERHDAEPHGQAETGRDPADRAAGQGGDVYTHDPDVDAGVHAGAPMAGRSRTSNFFASALRTRSSKGLAIFSAVVVLFGLFLAFRPVHHKKVVSVAESAPDVKATQGSAPPTPAYHKALTQSDQQRNQQAQATGSSALPTIEMSQPTTPPTPAQSKTSASYNQPTTTPAHAEPVIPSQPAGAGGQTTTTSTKTTGNRAVAPNVQVADQNRTQALVGYFNDLDKPPGAPRMVVFDKNNGNDHGGGQSSGSGTQTAGTPFGNRAVAGGNADNANAGAGANAGAAADPSTSTAANRPAGPYSPPAVNTVLYSILRFGVDSDAPGPVQGVIEQGKFRGARVLGSFQTTRSGDVIKFNTLTMPYTDADGNHRTQTIPIDAVAINPDTLNDNMATSVNDHLALRLAVSFASALASNFGQLLTESGASTLISPTGAIATSNPTLSTQQQIEAAGGQAVGTAGNIINQKFGQMPPTIKTAAGTPFALLFLKGGGQ